MKTESHFSDFLAGYTEALYWSSTGEHDDGTPYNLDDYEASTAAGDKCRADCRAFFDANFSDLEQAADVPGYSWQHAGHDFALTRNGHGAGYWDGDLPEALGDRLTEAAKQAGECWPYLGDDQLIYIE